VSRRRFLADGIAAGAALGLGVSAAAAQGDKPHRIDVHHHLAPPRWIADVVVGRKTGQRPLADWTPQRSIEDMDRGGVATSMVSISEPSVWFGDDAAARALARDCNEYGARLTADHPGRFGQFAILPLPDVEGSLREIEYAFDTLKADGICLMTSYQSKYLGDPAFAPVMDELNRRNAVVFTHPVRPDCCRNLVPDVAEPVIELATDTTRTVASVLFSGTATRCPDIRFIWSHGGGTMPFLYERYIRMPQLNPNVQANVPHGVDYELKKFYYDVAQVAHPAALASLTKVAQSSHILFGTDFPYRTSADHVKGVTGFFTDEAERRGVLRDNALAILPRLKTG
jgi:predicted TIM-barrel fold metal-dependent hydrolase